MRRRSFLLPSLLLALLAAGCGRSSSISNVPIGPGGQCKISVGDPRPNVLVRCSGPCASTSIKDGLCAHGAEGCEHRCDVYQDVEVCYLAEKVISVDRLDRVSGRQQWCFWPDPRAARSLDAPRR